MLAAQARLLITLFLAERGILPSPLLYLSAFFDLRRQEYYGRLQGVHARVEWEPWLAYFLAGVAARLNVAFTTAQRDRVYCATGLLKILEEPAKVAGQRATTKQDSTV